MYNSYARFNQNDSDSTIITHSFLCNHSNNPVNTDTDILNDRYSQQINQSVISKDNKYTNHDLIDATEQIEDILNYYFEQLKQESNTQLDCNQQLITRLINFIRPTYSLQKKNMNDLDILFNDILKLQFTRYTNQKDKNEQLNNQILYLKKLIITSNDDSMTNSYRINSMVDYEQLIEMENEIKKLSNLVELQRERINELTKLVYQEDISPFHTSSSDTIIAPLNEASTNKQQSTISNTNAECTLVAKVRALSDHQQDSGINILEKTSNELNSLDISPVESLIDFLTGSLADNINRDPPVEARIPVNSRILRPLSRMPSINDKRKCFICNHEFLSTANEFEIISHVERCLASAGIYDLSTSNDPTYYTCPKCAEQFVGEDESAYIQHLAECYSEAIDTI